LWSEVVKNTQNPQKQTTHKHTHPHTHTHTHTHTHGGDSVHVDAPVFSLI
jgi:hypothetical protein